MAAKWMVGTVPVFVAERDTSREIKRAELFVLDGIQSVFNFFGAGSKRHSVKGLITNGSYLGDLESYAVNDDVFTFSTPYGDYPSCRLDKVVKASTIKYASATIDGVSYDTATTELINVELEIIITG